MNGKKRSCMVWLDVTVTLYPGYSQPSTWPRLVESHVDPWDLACRSLHSRFAVWKTCASAGEILGVRTQENKNTGTRKW